MEKSPSHHTPSRSFVGSQARQAVTLKPMKPTTVRDSRFLLGRRSSAIRSVATTGDATDPRARGKEPATTTKTTKTTMQTRGRRATVSIFALVLAVLAGCASVARASPGDSFCEYWAAHLTCVAIWDATTCDANSLCTHNGSDCELTDESTHQMSVLEKSAPQSVALVMQIQTCTAISSEGECTSYCAWDDGNCLLADSFFTATYATCYEPETEETETSGTKCPETSGASRVGAGTATFVAGAVATAGLLLA